jgi:exodeoxyribonuclease-5
MLRKRRLRSTPLHAAKGLEWPIVVPVNTMTQIMAPENAITDRATGRFYCPAFVVKPTGYEAARDAEKAELAACVLRAPSRRLSP